MSKTYTEVDIEAVVFREDLYPRIDRSPTTVQKYAEDLTVLPPIEINQANELIDGWHRWTAHKKREATKINAFVTETKNDGHLLELAIERNAQFGFQLSTNDKKTMARRIYRDTPAEDRGSKKQRLADILSVSYATINNWLGRIDKDTAEERNAAVQNLYLQCYTQEEIESAIGCTRDVVREVLGKIQNFEIHPIPGSFSEDLADKTGAAMKAAEEERQAKIVAENKGNQVPFAPWQAGLCTVREGGWERVGRRDSAEDARLFPNIAPA